MEKSRFFQFSRYKAGMTAERALYDDPTALEESRQRALADIKAGRTVPHDDVARWLETWGSDTEKPMPSEWLR